jgi:uncharacterized membrane protein YqjE
MSSSDIRAEHVDRTKPKSPDKSLGQLFGDLSNEFSDLMQTHVELAKVELRSESVRAARAAGLFGGAALAGYMALVLLSFAAAWGLANVMAAGWAFLIVGAVYAALAAALFTQARQRFKDVNIVPQQTVESLKENVQWARQKMS